MLQNGDAHERLYSDGARVFLFGDKGSYMSGSSGSVVSIDDGRSADGKTPLQVLSKFIKQTCKGRSRRDGRDVRLA